jgi:hypothetical protein
MAMENSTCFFAKEYMDPISDSTRYLNEFPGTSTLYQIIIGLVIF